MKKTLIVLSIFIMGLALLGQYAHAEPVLPGGADIDRLKPEQREILPELPGEEIIKIPSQNDEGAPAPETAKNIHFTLKDVQIEGSTVYRPEQFSDIYQPYMDKEVTLDIAWEMAQLITKRYHDSGYFLSRAYVPAQEVKDGTIQIRIVEGYIGEVKIDQNAKNWLTADLVKRIKAEKPVKIETLEHQLLLLNDIPGYVFQATAEPINGEDEAEIRLTINAKRKPIQISGNIDNYGSRYLGPYEAGFGLSGSIAHGQQTSVSALTSLPGKELNSISGTHKIQILPEVSLEFFGGYSKAEPGYKLEVQEIKSRSISEGVAVKYQPIRQRQENLAFKLSVDARDSNSDILDAPLTRDRIRAYRVNASYDRADPWAGYNILSATFSHGIDGLGATQENDLYISRSQATPDFTKTEASYTRFQGINDDFNAVIGLSGQYSSQSLYSSEEFGYGGQNFGRAYDISEISGDSGVNGSLELRYQSLPEWKDFNFVPYGFYDIGRVWNNNIGQDDKISGSSTGIGIRFQHKSGYTGNLAIAAPLTKQVDTPVYGNSDKSLRYIFQLGYNLQ